MSENATLKNARTHQPVTRFFLSVVEGPERDLVFEVPRTGSRVLLGTSTTCAIKLSDAHISRRHLSVFATPTHLEVRDLGSTNGTTINAAIIIEANCIGGELIRVGNTTLRVESAGTAPPSEVHTATSFGRMIGISASMRNIFGMCTRFADADFPVLIEGDSGTGKELLAECLHETSKRSAQPFLVYDPKTLEESEQAHAVALFGAETKAHESVQPGIVLLANGGTLLIDSPTAIPLEIQRRLLRLIDRREVQAHNSARTQPVDVRIIVTSQIDLDRAVEEGCLREDLLQRLANARIEIPPLRSRREDIRALVVHFWQQFAGVGVPDVSKFEGQPWSGNVRELQNAVAQFAVSGFQERQRFEFATDAQRESSEFERIFALDLALPEAKEQLRQEFEREYISRVLKAHGGNVSRAAAASGIARRYFQHLKAKHRP
jgi:two-component system, NtrC family, response regulator HydG